MHTKRCSPVAEMSLAVAGPTSAAVRVQGALGRAAESACEQLGQACGLPTSRDFWSKYTRPVGIVKQEFSTGIAARVNRYFLPDLENGKVEEK
jgi:hypothetical protein